LKFSGVILRPFRPEWNEQADFVAWMRHHWPDDAAMMIHPANEGNMTAHYRQHQQMAGMLKGASDLILLKRGKHAPAALFEFKRCWHKAKPTSEQAMLLTLAVLDGKFAAVVNGFEAAKLAFIFYKKGLQLPDLGDRLQFPTIEGSGK
jgi:hypothetical protein